MLGAQPIGGVGVRSLLATAAVYRQFLRLSTDGPATRCLDVDISLSRHSPLSREPDIASRTR